MTPYMKTIFQQKNNKLKFWPKLVGPLNAAIVIHSYGVFKIIQLMHLKQWIGTKGFGNKRTHSHELSNGDTLPETEGTLCLNWAIMRNSVGEKLSNGGSLLLEIRRTLCSNGVFLINYEKLSRWQIEQWCKFASRNPKGSLLKLNVFEQLCEIELKIWNWQFPSFTFIIWIKIWGGTDFWWTIFTFCWTTMYTFWKRSAFSIPYNAIAYDCNTHSNRLRFTQIRLYLPFSDWSWTKWNSVWLY